MTKKQKIKQLKRQRNFYKNANAIHYAEIVRHKEKFNSIKELIQAYSLFDTDTKMGNHITNEINKHLSNAYTQK